MDTRLPVTVLMSIVGLKLEYEEGRFIGWTVHREVTQYAILRPSLRSEFILRLQVLVSLLQLTLLSFSPLKAKHMSFNWYIEPCIRH